MCQGHSVYTRQASEKDLEAIARVLVDTWRSTFRGLLSDDFLDGMSYEHQRERHARTMAGPRTAYFAAVDSRTDEVIGFANGGPNRHSDYPYSGELYAIYIREEYQRRGIGKSLFCALARRLVETGFSSMLVWVLVDNPNRRFYERIGGVPVGERPIKLGPATVTEAALVWSDLMSTLGSCCTFGSSDVAWKADPRS
ncbi:GNAT family N-acetyltransferase [Ensifer sp. IC4062]|nr:GNAT family N-acetyltransferase [Ensifer sp. IC4062]